MDGDALPPSQIDPVGGEGPEAEGGCGGVGEEAALGGDPPLLPPLQLEEGGGTIGDLLSIPSSCGRAPGDCGCVEEGAWQQVIQSQDRSGASVCTSRSDGRMNRWKEL